MTTIKDLINGIDNDDMAVQFMTHGDCDLSIRGKGTYLEAKFKSSPENIYKEAIVIWVDKTKLKEAARRINLIPSVQE